jgi:MFS family permease
MITKFNKTMHFAYALKSRPYALMWIGQAISSLGDWTFNVALAWQVLLMTHSSTSIGIVLLANMVPRLAFTLIGGVTADRFSRRTIILWSDGGRGLIVLMVSLLGFTGHLQLWFLIIESLFLGTFSGFFNPAVTAIVPYLVEKEQLSSASALTSFSTNLGMLLGPMLGALLITLFSPMAAFLLDALSFFISVIFLLFVRIPEHHASEYQQNLVETKKVIEEEKATHIKSKRFRRVIEEMQEGVSYVIKVRWLWVLIVALAFANVGYMATLSVAMPKLVSDVYRQGSWLLGLINTTGAIGAIIAIIVAVQAKYVKRRGLLGCIALGLPCIGMLIFGLPFPLAVVPMTASLASFLTSFGLSFFNTIWFTILYETVPSEKLGRVISIDSLGSFLMIPVGYIVGGIIADHIGPSAVFIFFGLFNAVFVLIPLFVHDVRVLE